ncbi:unnamed protein product [marine sediment metagenome]|uniref:Uncharacterized protein n=1 Tax=marine sediment metagenome TaxID=412755 RepID=X1FV13_9ZZZZ
MEAEKEHKPSKNQRRKALRYGKMHTDLQCPDNKEPHDANSDQMQFIQSLLQPRKEVDHSLDELEFEKRPRHILPGSFETGKRR